MPRPSRGRCVKDPRIGGVEETAVIGKTMRKKAALFTTAAAALLLLTGCSFFLPGAVGPGTSTDSDPVTPDPEYTAFLIAEGFPEDYAEKLSVLHVLHPAWTFEPLDVTGLSEGRYTWDYVVGEEYSDHRRNLVPPAERYIHMRDPSDLSLYDTGWYAASRPAIEYMMDPRNFLDEVQIFQFCSLAFSGSETPGSVESVLEGTFMEGAFLDGEYSGMTYAEFIFDTGRELGASPVYLAARIRNEQGVRGEGPTVSGSCGDYLARLLDEVEKSGSADLIPGAESLTAVELAGYNGLYNFFNIGASGDSLFAVCLGAMRRAEAGSPSMEGVWGSPSWNTKWKSILGGAKIAVESYIRDRQDTSYLQKFNVDPGSSGNFWAQYMQSVYGAYSQADSISSAYSAAGLTDIPWHFSIPVFSGMPESCPEPVLSDSSAPAVTSGNPST